MPQPHHLHDLNYKNLFTDPDMVASLPRSFAPADVVADMDFSCTARLSAGWAARCSTVQEARSTLADIAPHWEQTLMERGISIGRSEWTDIASVHRQCI